MDAERRSYFDDFDEAFEEALNALVEVDPTEEEVYDYYGPSHLCWYILERLKDDSPDEIELEDELGS